MRFIYTKEIALRYNMPFTYKWLIEEDLRLQKIGLGIEVYEADFDRLSINLYPLLNNKNESILNGLENELREKIRSHCCICGNRHDLQYIGRKGVPVCSRCVVLNGNQFDSIYKAFIYDFVKKNEDSPHIIPRQKVRLRAVDGHIFYKFSL